MIDASGKFTLLGRWGPSITWVRGRAGPGRHPAARRRDGRRARPPTACCALWSLRPTALSPSRGSVSVVAADAAHRRDPGSPRLSDLPRRCAHRQLTSGRRAARPPTTCCSAIAAPSQRMARIPWPVLQRLRFFSEKSEVARCAGRPKGRDGMTRPAAAALAGASPYPESAFDFDWLLAGRRSGLNGLFLRAHVPLHAVPPSPPRPDRRIGVHPPRASRRRPGPRPSA